MIVLTIAQLRAITERADIEEASAEMEIELDQPSRGDPGDWQHPVVSVRTPGTRLDGFLFAVDADGTMMEGP